MEKAHIKVSNTFTLKNVLECYLKFLVKKILSMAEKNSEKLKYNFSLKHQKSDIKNETFIFKGFIVLLTLLLKSFIFFIRYVSFFKINI